jgi:solute carrier family 35 (adenosine 3'-phospho 5'-phosphosulfate transporter), member B2
MPINSRENPLSLADLLFALCVNFLMYAALILVFYMLVRFYLDEEVDFDSNDVKKDGKVKSKAKKSIELKSLSSVSSEDYSLSSNEQEDSDLNSNSMENTKFTKMNMNSSYKIGKGASSSAAVGGSSGIAFDRSRTMSSESIESDGSESDGSLIRSSSTSKMSEMTSKSLLNLNEWGEPDGTTEEVYQRAIFCAVGLNIVFGIWGIIQERMLTIPYHDNNKNEFFEYSYGLVFMSRLGGLTISFILIKYYDVKLINNHIWEFSFPSVANMISSWCQYEALKYVSFPTAMLSKAFKLVPVMLMGKFMKNSVYYTYEYVSAGFIGFGLYLFLSSSETINFKQNVFGDTNMENENGTWCGLVLLGFFLGFDAFTSQWQSRMFDLHKQLSPLQMMVIMNGCSSIFSFITLIHQEELVVSFMFIYEHPSFALHLAMLIITATIGQIFIFYTVKNFGAVVFSIIMSIRILLSTLLSCYIYDHPVTELGVVGILIVFGAIAYRISRKADGKSLIRWKEPKPKAKRSKYSSSAVFGHWHEHMDDI